MACGGGNQACGLAAGPGWLVLACWGLPARTCEAIGQVMTARSLSPGADLDRAHPPVRATTRRPSAVAIRDSPGIRADRHGAARCRLRMVEVQAECFRADAQID